MSKKHKIVVAITGASGSIYAKVLLQKLQQLSDQIEEVGIVMSDNAKQVWQFEIGDETYNDIPYTISFSQCPQHNLCNTVLKCSVLNTVLLH